MATQNELDIIVRLKSQIAKDLKPVRQSLKGLSEDISLGAKPTTTLSNLFGGLKATLFSTTGVVVGAAGAVAGLSYFIKQSVPVTQEWGVAMGGLSSVAIRFGHDANEATEAAMRLSQDGLITPRTAAEGLKRLLTTGLGLDEATKLMESYTDMAAFGRSSTVDMNQAVLNLSQSFVTERSQLADNSGMYENYKEVVEAGARALGKKVSQLNYAERTEAKYLGTLMVATRAEGDAQRRAETYSGTMDKLSNAMYMLKVTVGSLVIPILNKLAGWLTTVLQVASAVINAIAPGWIQMGLDMVKGSSTGVSAISDLRKQFDELGGEASDTAKKIKQAMEDFAYDSKKALQDFRRSLADLVFSHKDKVVELKKQLEEEKKNLEERIEEMMEPYEELKKSAIQAGKDRLADLKAQLDKEAAKGKYANEEKIAMLEEFIKEEEEAIATSIAEWDAKAQEEIAIETAKAQERIDEIQSELEEEEAVLKKHAGIIASIKNLQREDDIARLIRQYDEETVERNRQHKQRLADLRDQGSSEGSTFSELFWDAIKEYTDTQQASLAESLLGGDIEVTLLDVLKEVPGVLADMFDPLINIGASIWEAILPKRRMSFADSPIGKFINAIRKGLSALPTLAAWAGGQILGGISKGISKAINKAWNWGAKMMSRIANGFKSAVSRIGSGIKSLVNKIIKWLNNALRAAPAPFSWIRIPTLAGGVKNFKGGLAVVGERGPELVNLPRGSDVIPNEQSRLATVNNYNTFNVQTPFDIDLAMERVAMKARATSR